MLILSASKALNAGHDVSSFLVHTSDGHPVAVFQWGMLHADGTDTRDAEVISKATGRTAIAFEASVVLHDTAHTIHSADLWRELRRVSRHFANLHAKQHAAKRREALRALATRRPTSDAQQQELSL